MNTIASIRKFPAMFGFLFCLVTGLLLNVKSASGQFIQQLRIEPAQPVSTSSVSLIADVAFPSGDCFEKSVFFSQTGPNRYEVSSIHCLGLLTVVCYDSDTIDFGLLPPGNYRVIYHVDAGFGPLPCTPGIVPGPTDSIDFTVNTASGIEEMNNDPFVIYPNPSGSSGDFSIQNNSSIQPEQLSIFGMDGRLLFQSRLKENQNQWKLSFLPDGIYQVIVKSHSGSIHRLKWIK